MAPTRPTTQRARSTMQRGIRIPLPAGPAAGAEARRHVREAICAWKVPVDSATAALLTSELVTNALQHAPDGPITLAISCACGQFHVDVHDTSSSLPMLVDGPVDAETGRGLILVASLTTGWGYYRTPAGKAVYFTLAFQVDPCEVDERRL